MENKKSLSPFIIVLLLVLGTCIVGICGWYGYNYFSEQNNNETKPSNVDGPVEDNKTNDLTNNSQADDVIDNSGTEETDDTSVFPTEYAYIVYSSKESDNYKKVDYSKSQDLKSNEYVGAYKDEIIIDDYKISLNTSKHSSAKGKKVESKDKIVSALVSSDCTGSIEIYYLTDKKDLYYSILSGDDASKISKLFESKLVSNNVEKIGYANVETYDTCAGSLIALKKINDNSNYVVHIGADKFILKSMNYENYVPAKEGFQYYELYVLYKNYPNEPFSKHSAILKNSNGENLYVKAIFKSNQQVEEDKDEYGRYTKDNHLYFLGEDDYLYHFPDGFSNTNVKATKYIETKVKNISFSGTDDVGTLTIEYVNGKTEKFEIGELYSYVNLDI